MSLRFITQCKEDALFLVAERSVAVGLTSILYIIFVLSEDGRVGRLLTQYCAGGKMEKNEMGWACGAYWGREGGV